MGEDFFDIVALNWKDGDPRNSDFDMKVNKELYETLEDNESVVLVTARDEDGTLAGYINFFIQESPHSRGLIQGSSDALYVAEDYRGKGIFKDMLTSSERLLRESYGVSYMSVTLRAQADSLEGYEKTDVVFGKVLKENI